MGNEPSRSMHLRRRYRKPRRLPKPLEPLDAYQGLGVARAPNPTDVPSSLRVVHDSVERDWDLTQRTLGTGFSGAVIMATHKTKPGLRAAVKSFSKKHKAARIAMLRNEIEVYLRLDHPNICRLLWAYESKDKVWLVMELCSEELYDKLCARKVFSMDDTAFVLAQMLRAINYLHSHNIVHRDLKLENWMFQKRTDEDLYSSMRQTTASTSASRSGCAPASRSPSGSASAPASRSPSISASASSSSAICDERIKLIDFGFSKILMDPSETLEVPCGTLHYASPDVLKRNYNAKCDIWSLGVICYMLLIGSPPFSASRTAQVLEKIKNGKVRLGNRWSVLNPVAQDFVLQCPTVDPEQRLDARQALQHPFVISYVSAATPTACLTQEVVSNLHAFAISSKLRRAASSVLAYELTSNEMLDFHDVFLSFDITGTGTLHIDDFIQVCQSHPSIDISENEIKRIFSIIAIDNEIHYTPFLAAMISKMHIDLDNVLQVFKLFDPSRDNFISIEDLVCVFEPIGLTAQEAELWVREHDVKGNGLLDYESLLVALNFSTPNETFPEVKFVNTHSDKSDDSTVDTSIGCITIDDHDYFQA